MINLRSRGLDASQLDQILITQLIDSNQNKNKKTNSKNSSKISISKIRQFSMVKQSSIFKRPRKVKRQIYHCFLRDCQYKIISINITFVLRCRSLAQEFLVNTFSKFFHIFSLLAPKLYLIWQSNLRLLNPNKSIKTYCLQVKSFCEKQSQLLLLKFVTKNKNLSRLNSSLNHVKASKIVIYST